MRKFEEDIKSLRTASQTFEEQIFKGSEGLIKELFDFDYVEAKSPQSEKFSELVEVRETTELGSVLHSIEQFAQKKVASLGDGGEAKAKLGFEHYIELDQFYNSTEINSYFDQHISSQPDPSIELKVLCLISSSVPEHLSLQKFLETEAGTLFLKMTESFKLKEGELQILLLRDLVHQLDFTQTYELEGKKELEMIGSYLLTYKPKYLVSFGGISTNFTRQKKENLSTIHGKFFPTKLSYGESSVLYEQVPLFHPSLLLVNSPMKKLTWEDMKKLIAKL